MNKKIKKLILRGILLSVISIPMCAKLINLPQYKGNILQYNFSLSKSGNVYSGKLITWGSVGENVSKVQRRLNELGYNVGNVDGIFGEKTKQAIINFQKSKTLNADGIIGSLTWQALFESTNTYEGNLITIGSTGESVIKVQKRLNDLGYNIGNIDGIFGEETKKAVKDFQSSKNLDADGIIGSLTWQALFESTNSYQGTLIKLGSTGQDVLKIQEKLNKLGFDAGTADGVFGNNTKTAVMNYQRNNGLEVDGIVGQLTWDLLFSNDIVIPSIPDKEETDNQSPSDSIDKDNSVEEDADKDNSVSGDNNQDNSEEDSEEDKNGDDSEKEDTDKDNSVDEGNNDDSSEEDEDANDSVTVDSHKIISFAYNLLGLPYQWGAVGPNAFDCSGFTLYVYKNVAGIDIGRTTYDQIKAGREVSKDELQPGDLVFAHSGHVAMYVGNGQIIHVPQTGDVVRITSMGKFWRARRIL